MAQAGQIVLRVMFETFAGSGFAAQASSVTITIAAATDESGQLTPPRPPDRPRPHQAGQTVTIAVSEATLAIELGDTPTRVVRRTTTPVRNIKADRPWTVSSVS